ncbi:MAG: polysaccharide deacetylase family protein [Clostridia bacterium]|nr:polysaccharide deacetylase family protein [Clostridia bacterium]
MIKYQFICFPGGKRKAVTLSYDDGDVEDLRFSDVITNAGLKCTFNLNSNVFKKNVITDRQIQEKFLDRGHEVAVHGFLHTGLSVQRPIEGIKEVLNCRLELEQRFDRIIRGMAYPSFNLRFFENGTNYEIIRNYLKDLGIAYSRTVGEDNCDFRLPEDWYRWMPSAHHSNPEILEYIDKFLNVKFTAMKHPSRLFYMWGHAYEFERNNNWELLDQICEKLSGHDDIWYATNIEIYEYVNAYNSLVHSADASKVYNPTVHTIWFVCNGEPYTIKPGETIYIKPWESM